MGTLATLGTQLRAASRRYALAPLRDAKNFQTRSQDPG